MKTLVETTGLTKQFGEGHEAVIAVDDVNISIDQGELLMIMGESGSGKL